MTFSVREVSLGEVCDIKQGKYLAPNQMAPTPTNDCFVPVIGGNGVLGYTNSSTFPFPVPLVTCRGSKCGLMQWAEPPTWISNNAMAVYFKENQGDNFFLYQYLLNSSFDDVITGSAQPQITVKNLSLKKIMLPDLKTQQSISLIMKNIERKIALNSLLSQTLEGIAQTIYKSWFIDFDPVKAMMVGEKPEGMDASTAALFPDSLEESELGLIPIGWSIEKIGNVSDIRGGKMLSREEFTDDGLSPIFGGAGVMGYSNKCNAEGFVITLGRVGAYCGRFFYHRGAAWVNNNASRIIPVDSISGEWMYLSLNSFDIEGIKKGAAQPFVSNSDLANSKLLMPPTSIIERFTEIARPIFKQCETLKYQVRLLAELRDSLLHRLISGDLQIPEETLAS